MDEQFALKFYQHSGNAKLAHLSTERCCLECRLFLEGREIIAGVPYDALAGETAEEKFKMLANMQHEVFMALVGEKGFLYRSAPGAMVIIPPRFCLVNIAVDDVAAHGMMWQLMGSRENQLATVAALQARIAFHCTESDVQLLSEMQRRLQN